MKKAYIKPQMKVYHIGSITLLATSGIRITPQERYGDGQNSQDEDDIWNQY